MTRSKKILLVDDDALILEIYRKKFANAGFYVETAQDGLAAMKLLTGYKPDAVVLDLMMPKLGGIDVLKYIRSSTALKDTPVVILSNSYMSDVAQDAAQVGADKALLKQRCTPDLLIELINDLLAGGSSKIDPSLLLAAPQSKPAAPQTTATPTPLAPSPAAPSAPPSSSKSETTFISKFREEFLASASTTKETLHHICENFLTCSDAKLRPFRLLDLYRKVHFLTSIAGMVKCPQIAQLSSALEALLMEMHEQPSHINPSSRQTVTAAVAFLGELLDRAHQHLEEVPLESSKILAVDDDVLTNRIVTLSLQRAGLKAASAAKPSQAIDRLREPYDLILLDVGMPEMDGFQLCEKIRNMPGFETIPIVFVTSHSETQSREQCLAASGSEPISKPILPSELAVKAITHLLRLHLGRQTTATAG